MSTVTIHDAIGCIPSSRGGSTASSRLSLAGQVVKMLVETGTEYLRTGSSSSEPNVPMMLVGRPLASGAELDGEGDDADAEREACASAEPQEQESRGGAPKRTPRSAAGAGQLPDGRLP